jgi:hypothetical protein
LQEDDVYYCDYYCATSYVYYPERFGCEAAQSGMCIEDEMLRRAEAPCIYNFVEDECDTGEFSFYYMYACA